MVGGVGWDWWLAWWLEVVVGIGGWGGGWYRWMGVVVRIGC